MTTLLPVELRLVEPQWADRVPSPSHDALTPEQRRTFLGATPDSYLAVTRSPEDLDRDGNPSTDDAEQLLRQGRLAFERLLDKGAFGPVAPASLYAYQLELRGHRQTGVVGGIPLDEYTNGELRIHERIRGNRTDHLARHFAVVGIQSSPIAVTHRPNPALQTVLSEITGQEPMLVARGADGLVQRVWPIIGTAMVAIMDSLADQPTYIIDGHHRAAARAKFAETTSQARAQQLLCALFDADQLQNRAFHRWLRRTDLDHFVATIDRRVDWRHLDGEQVETREADELACYGAGRWIAVRLPLLDGRDLTDRLANLDPVRLDAQVLRPLLGIEPTSDSAALGYRPGSRRLERLTSEIDLEGGVLCVTRPVPVDLLLDAADAGLVMPPKSTYFEPKVRSGVFVRPIA